MAIPLGSGTWGMACLRITVWIYELRRTRSRRHAISVSLQSKYPAPEYPALWAAAEAAANIPAEIQIRHPEVPWRLMSDIAHQYFRVNLKYCLENNSE